MAKHRYIRPLFAAFMMLVMAFSITPKRTVHDIFGCHDGTTTPYKHHKGKETGFNKDGFHCACEQQEFQTAFTNSVNLALPDPFYFFVEQGNTDLDLQFYTALVALPSLRGPPALAATA